MTEFLISPNNCPISYACTDVVESNQAVSSIDCNDLSFDGVFNGDPTDGVLTFVATETDYTSGNYRPGEYTVTITGTADASDPLL